MFCASVFAAGETPEQILKAVDGVTGAPKDQTVQMKLTLIEKGGKQSAREMTEYQQGAEKRVSKFTSPADQKGIAFLSLPNDEMYLYLPAFSKVRRVASHVKNTKFAGTDFTYEDLDPKDLSITWDAKSVKSADGLNVLELALKSGKTSDYSKLVLSARQDNNYPVKIDMYDKSGKLFKVLTREDVKQFGAYWTSMKITMNDLKSGHTTIMDVTNPKFDTGIPADTFTERFLSK